MAKSTGTILIELTLYQCCIADLAVKYILKEMYGHQNIDCLLNKVIYGTTLIENLRCPTQILNREYLTQQELEDELEKLNNLCGCALCDDIEELTNDQISTALSNLIKTEDNGFIELED